MQHLPIPPERDGLELDEFLCLSFPMLSKGFLRRQVRDGKITVDGGPAVPSQRIREHQVVLVDFDEDEETREYPPADDIELTVLYEDAHVLAVDKPAHLSAEPERWQRDAACLSGALLAMALKRSDARVGGAREPAEGLEFRPRLVHRLDKDTTGVCLVAKSIEAERELRAAFDAGVVNKTYLAIVEGEFEPKDGVSETIDLPIGPDERRSGRMRVDHAEGKPSQTRVSVVERYRGYTLVRAEPLTGRTHQIRVHMREIGFPLVVDPVYGRNKSIALSQIKQGYKPKRGGIEHPLIDRLTLHAQAIEFPAVGEPDRRIRVESPLPKDFARTVKQLSKVRAP